MPKLALLARFEAKPGKEAEVAQFLQNALEMSRQEPMTLMWFALQLGPNAFGVFDCFDDEVGRQTHLNGPIAKGLMANAPELFAGEPSIEPISLLGAKLPA